jgi:protein required for attachment to host cells
MWPISCIRPAVVRASNWAATGPATCEGTGHGLGSVAYLPRTDPREREHERFAAELAHTIDEAVAAGRCAGIVLVASNPFLGAVKSHLSPQSRKALLRTVAADYTSLDEKELARRLASGD